jgi:hypothetical protein
MHLLIYQEHDKGSHLIDHLVGVRSRIQKISYKPFPHDLFYVVVR